MKSLTMNPMLALVFATGAMMVASTVASAAELKFDIPFKFQVRGKVMEPGLYKVRTASGEARFFIQNAQSGEGVYVLPMGSVDPRKEWSGADGGVMQFACSGSGCTIRQIWTHGGYPAHTFTAPKSKDEGPTRVALIRAVTGNAK